MAPIICSRLALDFLGSGVRVIRWAAVLARLGWDAGSGLLSGRAGFFPSLPKSLASRRISAMGHRLITNRNTMTAQENQSSSPFFFCFATAYSPFFLSLRLRPCSSTT